jgi:hypothetical protein
MTLLDRSVHLVRRPWYRPFRGPAEDPGPDRTVCMPAAARAGRPTGRCSARSLSVGRVVELQGPRAAAAVIIICACESQLTGARVGSGRVRRLPARRLGGSGHRRAIPSTIQVRIVLLHSASSHREFLEQASEPLEREHDRPRASPGASTAFGPEDKLREELLATCPSGSASTAGTAWPADGPTRPDGDRSSGPDGHGEHRRRGSRHQHRRNLQAPAGASAEAPRPSGATAGPPAPRCSPAAAPSPPARRPGPRSPRGSARSPTDARPASASPRATARPGGARRAALPASRSPSSSLDLRAQPFPEASAPLW